MPTTGQQIRSLALAINVLNGLASKTCSNSNKEPLTTVQFTNIGQAFFVITELCGCIAALSDPASYAEHPQDQLPELTDASKSVLDTISRQVLYPGESRFWNSYKERKING